MATSSPEKLRSSIPPAPSTKYRDDFLALLDKRWGEFDAATLKEAQSKNIFGIGGDTKTLRDNDSDFQSAKATFDDAKATLSAVKTDTELKTLLKGPGKLSSTILALESYFAKLNAPEKAKEHNQVLANTLADLTSLKAQLTNSAEDKKSAEIAKNNVTAIPTQNADTSGDSLQSSAPAIAATVAGVGTAVVGSGLMSEKGWKKTLAEGFGKFKDWVASFFDEDSMLGSLLGGFKDKIMGLFTAIGLKLGIKPKEGHKEGSQSESENTLTHTDKIHGKKGASKVFEKLTKSGKVKDSNLQQYFVHENMLSRSKSELTKFLETGKKDKKLLAKELGFDENDGDKVYAALNLLLSADTANEMKSVGVKNAEDIPIGKLFSSVAKYADFLDKVREKGKNIDLKDFAFNQSADIKSGIGEFIGEKKELLEGFKDRYHGFSPRVLNMIHTGYTTRTLQEGTDFKANIATLNDDEKKFLLETLPEYGKKLPDMLKKFSFGSPEASEAILEHLKDPGLKYPDLIDFFVLSGGNTDMDAMNSFEKSQVITRIFLMLRSKKGRAGYKYITALTGAVISDKSTMNIPPDVKILLGDLGGVFKDATLAAANELKEGLIGVAEANPVFATLGGGTFIGILGLAIGLSPVGRIVSTFTWLLTLLGISSAVYLGYKITSEGKVIEEKTGKQVGDIVEMAKTQGYKDK